ncbi:unnamed protein product, partial [marine sediment metagenome]
VRLIFDKLLKEVKEKTWFEDIADLFGKNIEAIGLFNISVRFAPPQKDLKELVREFPASLNNFLEKLKEKKVGLFIALDDINYESFGGHY